MFSRPVLVLADSCNPWEIHILGFLQSQTVLTITVIMTTTVIIIVIVNVLVLQGILSNVTFNGQVLSGWAMYPLDFTLLFTHLHSEPALKYTQ